MRVLLWGMGGLLAALLYLLVLGESGLWDLREQALEQERLKQENEQLAERNRKLTVQIEGLRDGTGGVEDIAREKLGMIRKGEEFYQYSQEPPPSDSP